MKEQEEDNPGIISGLHLFIVGAWGLAWSSVFWKFGQFANPMLTSWLFGVSMFFSLGLMMLACGNSQRHKILEYGITFVLMFIFPFVGTCLILEEFIGVTVYRQLETQHLRAFLYLYFLSGMFYLLEVTRIRRILMCLLLAIAMAFVTQYFIRGDKFIITSEVSIFYISVAAWLLFWSYHDYHFRKETGRQMEKLRFLGNAIAHEMRTPLGSITSGADTIKEKLPVLLKKFLAHNTTTMTENQTVLMHHQLDELLRASTAIAGSAKDAGIIVDMLLMKVRNENRNLNYGILCDAEEIIQIALKEYPFKPGQSEKINFVVGNNFAFYSNPEAIKHVIFNLMKNALYQIDKHNKGSINIWLSQNDRYNFIHLRDTAIGIKEEHLIRIFEESDDGCGIGLPFCKLVIDNSKGIIDCISKYEKFTEFVLKFNKDQI